MILSFALCVCFQARDQKTLGDMRAAQECSDKAKWYNILASGWNLLIPLLVLGLLVLLLVHLGSSEGTFDFFGEDGFQSFMKLFSRQTEQLEQTHHHHHLQTFWTIHPLSTLSACYFPWLCEFIIIQFIVLFPNSCQCTV